MLHTTQLRGTEFEIAVPVKFLEKGAFDVQAISTVQTVKLMRKLGEIGPDHLRRIEDALLEWLEIE